MKEKLQQALLDELHKELALAQQAADNAHLAATDDQSVAETQYDTLAIEASYLAEGHSKRVSELKESIYQVENMSLKQSLKVDIGSLVTLYNKPKESYFIAPTGAGFKCLIEGQVITVISPSAPMAQALLGKRLDDEILLKIGNHEIEDEISQIH